MSRRFFALAVLLCLSSVRGFAADAPKPAWEEGSFDSNGVKIHYITQGEGDPVLLIHGYTVNGFVQWVAPGVFKALAEDYRVIALDNRGHGKSGKPHEADKYGTEMVEDAVRLLDHLKIEKAHVAGYSMGGFITAKLVATHPERVRTATLGGAGWMRAGDPTLSSINVLADSLDAGKGFGPLFRALQPAGRPPLTDEQIAGFSKMIEAGNDLKALAAVARGMSKLGVTEEQLKANKVPALALIGEVDPLKAGVDAMQGVMANLEIVVLPGADHMNAPSQAAFTGKLLDFLGRHGGKTADQAANAAPAGR